MKLKYKKMILLTTMSTMGIGLLTLSVSHDKTDAKEGLSSQIVTEAAVSEDTAVEALDFNADLTQAPSELVATPTPEPSPTPTPLPVYPIEKQGTYPKIDKLMDKYYSAKSSRNIDALEALFTDSSEADSKEELQAKTEYIDEYRNVKIYTKKGFKEGTYIVYVYSEVKFTGIDTPAPGLAQFYIVTDSDKKLKIFSGKMDDETYAYYKERNSDEDVVALIEMTNKKGEEALKKDEDLSNFWKKISEISNNSSDAAQTEGNGN